MVLAGRAFSPLSRRSNDHENVHGLRLYDQLARLSAFAQRGFDIFEA